MNRPEIHRVHGDEMNERAASESHRAPEEVAHELATRLRRSDPMPLRPRDQALLQGTTRFTFGDGRVGWSIGDGPLVLMVHGWGGRGVQLAVLAHRLATEGYRCVFFDAGGHGDSRAEGVGFDTFIEDTSSLTRIVGEPVRAWIGHSAGALGMMAARKLRGLSADCYVCVCAPRYPYVPIETLERRLAVTDEVLSHVKTILAAQFATTWEDLEQNAAFHPDPKPLLLAYDRGDERVRHHDADAIAAIWQGAEILKTDGHGHNKILQAPELGEAVCRMLRQTRASASI